MTAAENRVEVRITAHGYTYVFTVVEDNLSPLRFDLNWDRAPREVTEFGVDLFRRFEPGTRLLVDLTLSGLVAGEIERTAVTS